MPISIRDREAEEIARELAEAEGTTITQVVKEALQQKQKYLRNQKRAPALAIELKEIARRCNQLPVVDERPPDEIIGYNSIGAFDGS